MTNPMIRIHNVETGEIIDREMTAEEVAEQQAGYQADLIRRAEKAEAEVKKQALLDRLDITAEEARLLLS